MGKDRGNIQSASEHLGHLVPCFIHFPAIDSLNGQPVENDLIPVNGNVLSRDSKQGNLAAVAACVP